MVCKHQNELLIYKNKHQIVKLLLQCVDASMVQWGLYGLHATQLYQVWKHRDMFPATYIGQYKLQSSDIPYNYCLICPDKLHVCTLIWKWGFYYQILATFSPFRTKVCRSSLLPALAEIYRVIQEELPPLMELISEDILSKKCHINLGPILNIYRGMFVIRIFLNFNFNFNYKITSS
jgi:hypothetical protein